MLKSLGPALAVAMTLALPVSSHAEEAGPRSWSRLFEACTGTCQELLQSLAPEDATALRELPERVARTLEEFDGEDYELLPAPVQGALARVQNLGRTTAIALNPDKRGCTLFWFGFLDEGGSVVGRHQCRIDEKDGELSLTKLTGEGLSVRLVELEGGNVAVGRTYLPEQKERHYDRDRPNNRGNENFGNFVGLAFPDEGGRLVIVSADMHGHTEPDDTFFEVLVVE
jgi:hypothetical protein